MKEPKRDTLGRVLAGEYTDFEKLSDKVNNLIESRVIQISADPVLSPKRHLEQTITYEIYDCLHVHGSLTPAEIHSLIKYSNPDTIGHYLERMSLIGITQPVNYASLTRADLPIKGFGILPTLNERKKWELTEYIRE